MSEVESFGLAVLAASAVGIAAILSNRASERLRIPSPAIFLICAAVASDLWPTLGRLSVDAIEQIVTLALVVILFDGGLHIGMGRFRSTAAPIVWIGVAGTFVTTGALAVLAHFLFSFEWRTALLLGTALAPTDPAVVFSVLGRREIVGRSGTLIEGESGANDPVSIALIISLLVGGSGATVGSVFTQFMLQMVVGAVVGVAGGRALLAFMRRVPLPSEGLYPLRVLAGGLALYGLATVAHGSGFLAVFVAGILLGDERAPYKGEIERFHSALASLAEIIAFILLGLTIRLNDLPNEGALVIGLVLAVLLTFVVRPVLVGLLLWPVDLRPGERLFVLWTGLKGAVPILLGTFILRSGLSDAPRVYGIIFTVVAFSVVVQGSLVPFIARKSAVPLRQVEPEPWSLGVRFRHEPEGLHRLRVESGSIADGPPIRDLPCGEGVWVSLVLRAGRLVPVQGSTRLRAGDEVFLLADPSEAPGLPAIFSAPRRHPSRPDGAGGQ
jgi:cell volume regulation protein A